MEWTASTTADHVIVRAINYNLGKQMFTVVFVTSLEGIAAISQADGWMQTGVGAVSVGKFLLLTHFEVMAHFMIGVMYKLIIVPCTLNSQKQKVLAILSMVD